MPPPARWLALPPTLRGHLSQVEAVGGAGGGARPVLGGDACDVISSSTHLPFPWVPFLAFLLFCSSHLESPQGGGAGPLSQGDLSPQPAPNPVAPFLKKLHGGHQL